MELPNDPSPLASPETIEGLPDLRLMDASLAINTLTLRNRRDELLACAADMPTIVTADIAKDVADTIRLFTAALKAAEAERSKIKEPILAAGKLIDSHFGRVSGPLKSAKDQINERLTIHLREVEAAERVRRAEEERLKREAAERAAWVARHIEQNSNLAISAAKEAEQTAADLAKAERATAVKAAELTRTRGDLGAVASLRTDWTFANLERRTIDLEALRQHLALNAIEAAVRSFIKAGGRELRGVDILETTIAGVA